jgi:alanine racemase
MHSHNTWIEIKESSIQHNIKSYSSILPKNSILMPVIKANAYGHGLDLVMGVISKNKNIKYVAVFSIIEAIQIRKINKTIHVLMLCQINEHDLPLALKHNIHITIASLDMLIAVSKYKTNKKINVHIKIDTGLSRQGLQTNEINHFFAILAHVKNINIIGIYSHLIGAESKKYNKYTTVQIQEFALWKDAFHGYGMHPLVHISATAGAMLLPDIAFDMTRMGIGLYGLYPSNESQTYPNAKKLTLRPVLSLKTKIIQIKKIKKGSSVGYDATYIAQNDMTIAILPVGYYDGLSRELSNNAEFLYKGKRCRILGRVMMNMCALDVSHITNPKPGDTVTIIGKDGKEHLTVDELASITGTINYEIVTRLGQHIPRIAVK